MSANPMPVTRTDLILYLADMGAVRAKPLSARGVEILEAASNLLREGGFEAFSMRRVAERADMALSALQHHFPTRADLLRDVIEHRLAWYGAALSERLRSLPDEPERLFLGVVDWLLDDIQFEPTASFTVQFWAFAAYDADAREMLDRFMGRYRVFLAKIMRALNPALTELEALTRSAAISVMIDGSALLLAPGKPAHPELVDLHETIRSSALRLAKGAPKAE
ncbi:MAG: TetR/AcrR family transcriptional regulator [Phenylobacterium sp.]|uniref:TetR/AcrR family transcriptional regulator n=1 Tax=Phenylobacterium sp. TaxID=1871053 RepID=UPI003BB574D6